MIKLYFDDKPPYNLILIKGYLKIEITFDKRTYHALIDHPTSFSLKTYWYRLQDQLLKYLHENQVREILPKFLKDGYYERVLRNS